MLVIFRTLTCLTYTSWVCEFFGAEKENVVLFRNQDAARFSNDVIICDLNHMLKRNQYKGYANNVSVHDNAMALREPPCWRRFHH